jgi:hypothetical protein
MAWHDGPRACDTSVVERAGAASWAENRSGNRANRHNLPRDGHGELRWRRERRELRRPRAALPELETSGLPPVGTIASEPDPCAAAGHKLLLPLHLVLLLTPARGCGKRSPGQCINSRGEPRAPKSHALRSGVAYSPMFLSGKSKVAYDPFIGL